MKVRLMITCHQKWGAMEIATQSKGTRVTPDNNHDKQRTTTALNHTRLLTWSTHLTSLESQSSTSTCKAKRKWRANLALWWASHWFWSCSASLYWGFFKYGCTKAKFKPMKVFCMDRLVIPKLISKTSLETWLSEQFHLTIWKVF